MNKITLVLVFMVLLFPSSVQATKWASEGIKFQQKAGENIPAEKTQCDCTKAGDIKRRFSSSDDKEIWQVINNGSEDDFSELISRYNQKSADSHIAGNIFGRLFYKSIELMIIKHYALKFPNNFSPEFFSGSESVLLDEELQKVLNSLEELEKNCFFKTSIK
ncbi:MAG: hypothetical protein Q7U36_01705 [bacterium]|nr:hypothetical protein [bacterium]